MTAAPVSKKLRIKPGDRVRLLAAPAGMTDTLAPLPEGAGLTRSPSGADVAILFVRTLAEAEAKAASAFAAIRPGGIVWISYPKQTSKAKTDINRDILWAALADSGWRPVAQVAVDDIWSAMRFRPADEVGT